MRGIFSVRNQSVLQRRGKLLVGYLVAGYPDPETFFSILKGCASAGLDIFEIGYPSENPFLDGEVIRKAHQVVDHALISDISYWKRIRSVVNQPVWAMGYSKELQKGEFHTELAQNSLVDTFVIPDIIESERKHMAVKMAQFNVNVMAFVNPDMALEEVRDCFSSESLIYQQLYSGPTGISDVKDHYKEILTIAKEYSDVRIFAGFGINSSERALQLLASGFDGVIVGTAMMQKLNVSPQALYDFIYSIKSETEKDAD